MLLFNSTMQIYKTNPIIMTLIQNKLNKKTLENKILQIYTSQEALLLQTAINAILFILCRSKSGILFE